MLLNGHGRDISRNNDFTKPDSPLSFGSDPPKILKPVTVKYLVRLLRQFNKKFIVKVNHI